jgi:predicted glycoside hydrolase/deacetylase ChbG (UPF0249 family)
MPTRLIINADDFGLTPGVNRAIAELHQAGALTSATLMANGTAFDDAVAIAHANPTLGVGCHVVLTDGDPVSQPQSIPSLLGPNSGLDRRSLRPKLLDFVRDLVLGRISELDIEREATAQIRKLQHAGIAVTHIDTHKHTHMFPQVTRPLLRVAEAHGIRAIRHPFEARWSWSLGHGGVSRRIQMKILDQLRQPFNAQPEILFEEVRSTTGSIGISATGDLDQQTLVQIMATLPEGTWELVCHPGYNDTDLDGISTRLRSHRKIEYDALLAVIPEILSHPNPPTLIHYGDL